MTDTDEFLEHFGIKGMKWGVVHTPDSATGRVKPTAAATQVKREGRAQKYVKRADNFQRQIDTIQAKEHNRFTQRSANKQVKELEGYKAQALRDAQAKRNGKLSKGQKQFAIGATAVAALLVSAAAYTYLESGEGNRSIARGKAFLEGKSAPEFKKNAAFADKSLDADGIFENVVKNINPGYGKPGTTNNCRRATFAYEMRRRGFDVQATKTGKGYGQTAGGLANALSPGKRFVPTQGGRYASELIREQTSKAKHRATPISDIRSAFNAGGKTKIEKGPTGTITAFTILERLAKEPDGSRGELGVVWKGGGGHSMAYEIVNGKPVIFDAQAGKKISTLVEAVGHGMGALNDAAFTRLDNVPLNEDYLLRWVKNAK